MEEPEKCKGMNIKNERGENAEKKNEIFYLSKLNMRAYSMRFVARPKQTTAFSFHLFCNCFIGVSFVPGALYEVNFLDAYRLRHNIIHSKSKKYSLRQGDKWLCDANKRQTEEKKNIFILKSLIAKYDKQNPKPLSSVISNWKALKFDIFVTRQIALLYGCSDVVKKNTKFKITLFSCYNK